MIAGEFWGGIATMVFAVLIILLRNNLARLPKSRFLYRGGTTPPTANFYLIIGVIAIILAIILIALSLSGIDVVCHHNCIQ